MLSNQIPLKVTGKTQGECDRYDSNVFGIWVPMISLCLIMSFELFLCVCMAKGMCKMYVL